MLKPSCRYKHLSVISAISEQGDLHFSIQEESFTGQNVVGFLKSLLSFFDRKLLIIWGDTQSWGKDTH